MEVSGRQDRRQQLFIRAITNGVLSERDYMLSFTVGDFYNEMSLFIEETEKKIKALETAQKRSK